MEVNCEFTATKFVLKNRKSYTCIVRDIKIEGDAEWTFFGDHADGKSNQDVVAVSIKDSDIPKIPSGLTKSFPNLKTLLILRSNLKSVSKEDLKELNQLTDLLLRFNDLRFLPGDLLEDMKELETVSFGHNKISFIEPNILDGLTKLKFVSFSKNANINLWSDSIRSLGNSTLEQIKVEIKEKFTFSITRELKEKFEIKMNKIKEELTAEFRGKIIELQDDIQAKDFELNEIKNDAKSGTFSDVKKFLQNEETKDFVIKINSTRRKNIEFKVHKFLLAARSSTFAEMLKNNPDAEKMNLLDISAEILQKILDFIYKDQLPDDNFLKIFLAADKLGINKLKEFTIDETTKRINDKNSLELLIFANKLKIDNLKLKCFENIQKMFPDKELNAKLMDDPEKLRKMIEIKNRKAQLDAELENTFQKINF